MEDPAFLHGFLGIAPCRLDLCVAPLINLFASNSPTVHTGHDNAKHLSPCNGICEAIKGPIHISIDLNTKRSRCRPQWNYTRQLSDSFAGPATYTCDQASDSENRAKRLPQRAALRSLEHDREASDQRVLARVRQILLWNIRAQSKAVPIQQGVDAIQSAHSISRQETAVGRGCWAAQVHNIHLDSIRTACSKRRHGSEIHRRTGPSNTCHSWQSRI